MLAQFAGARVVPTGNGKFIAQHHGQSAQMDSLREVAAWLASIAPDRASAVEVAALRNTKFLKAIQVERKRAKRALREEAKS
jgi:hypothetical protein